MLLNARHHGSVSLSTLSDGSFKSFDFEMSDKHLEDWKEIERKVNKRVRNMFKLALASHAKNIKEKTFVCELINLDPMCSIERVTRLSSAYRKLFKEKNVDEQKLKEEIEWKKLNEDLIWFVTYNAKKHGDLSYHKVLKEKRDRISEAKGTYYKNAIRKKIVTLNLVKWFKKRLRIEIKKGKELKIKQHAAKYKIMRHAIVNRLLKDIIACGVNSYIREKFINCLTEKNRTKLIKRKFAENRCKFLIHSQIQNMFQKLAKASKFALYKRKMRTQFINNRLLRITKALQRKAGRKKNFKMDRREMGSKEFQYRYWLNELQHRLNSLGREGASIANMVGDSKTILLNIVKEELKREGSPHDNLHYIEEAFHHNIKKIRKNPKPKLKKPKPKNKREFKLDEETENMVRRITDVNTMHHLSSTPKKLTTESRPSFKPLSKNYLSLAKDFILKNTKFKTLFKNEYNYFLSSIKQNKTETTRSNKFNQKQFGKKRDFKVGKRQLPRCTVQNLKTARQCPQISTEILRKQRFVEKKSSISPWKPMPRDSDIPVYRKMTMRYSSSTYRKFVDNLKSRVKAKEPISIFDSSDSVLHKKGLASKKSTPSMSDPSRERISPAYSKTAVVQQKYREDDKKRLEQTVFRSPKTRYEEMKVTPAKDKNLRVTNILGGTLARHAWKKFYTGKSEFKTYERVQIMLNPRNKRGLGVDFKLYKPYKPTNNLQYYLIVEGFDLTPRKFKSKLFPYCPVTHNALSFFSDILKESDNIKKIKEDFDQKRSISWRTSRTNFSQSLWHHSSSSHNMPHQLPLETEKNTENSDVPPMFSLREELRPKTEIPDRKNLKFRVILQETETINLIYLESKFLSLATNVTKMTAVVKDIDLEEFETHEISKFKGFRGQRSLPIIQLPKRRSTLTGRKKFKHPTKSPSRKPDKLKFRRDTKDKMSESTLYSEDTQVLQLGHKKSPSLRKTVSTSAVNGKLEKAESEEDLGEHVKAFANVGVQAVGRSVCTTKTQVSAPKRNNAVVQITPYDFYHETANNVKSNILTPNKETTSKTEDNLSLGSDSSSEDSEFDSRDPLLVTKSNDFKDSLFMISRVLSSNFYNKAQLFYSRHSTDPLATKLTISYHCSDVWTFHDYRIQLSQLIATSIATHPIDNFVIAVGYAKNDMACQDFGIVCIWNVKNISAPEKIVKFDSSVTYVEFSNPNMLSVALMRGYVAMVNISKKRNNVVMNTKKKPTGCFLPIWRFTWFIDEDGGKFPVTCGADGCLYRYRMDGTFAPHLLMEATAKEGSVHGIEKQNSIFTTSTVKEKPEMTTCVQHPTDIHSYLIGTSDGCVHICSLQISTHIEYFEAQHGRVNAIKFHPHCEHIFLTVGGDFSVRVWAIGIFEPLFTFTARNEYAEDAFFNQIWPELMVSVSGEYVDIWNIRRKVDVPVQSWTNPKQLRNTTIAPSTDGYSIIVGDVGGYVHVFRLCEMPCESKLKPEVLADAIKSAISGRKQILAALTKLGYPFSTKPLPTHPRVSFSEKSEPKPP